MNTMKYIDIHCHLDFPDYEKDLEDVLGRMKENEVGAITIGTDLESSKRAVEIAEANEEVWACIGVHPNHIYNPPSTPPLTVRGGWPARFESRSESGGGELFAEFEKLIQSPKVVGIGECGLDFFRIKNEEDKIRQKELFESQIQFAMKHNKPLMLHCRNAYGEVLEILENYKKEAGEKLRGNCHFFAGSPEEAKKFVELGFTCSFTGVITFTNDYNEVIKSLSIESTLSETDAPFVAPVPYRGKRNEPSYVVEVVKRMAQIKGQSEERMAEAVVNNAKRVFNLE